MLEPHSPVQHCTVQYCTALYCTSPAHNCTSACTGQVCSHVPGVNKYVGGDLLCTVHQYQLHRGTEDRMLNSLC